MGNRLGSSLGWQSSSTKSMKKDKEINPFKTAGKIITQFIKHKMFLH